MTVEFLQQQKLDSTQAIHRGRAPTINVLEQLKGAIRQSVADESPSFETGLANTDIGETVSSLDAERITAEQEVAGYAKEAFQLVIGATINPADNSVTLFPKDADGKLQGILGSQMETVTDPNELTKWKQLAECILLQVADLEAR